MVNRSPAEDKTPSQPPATSAVRAEAKQALLRRLLARPEGASLNELETALGWQPHTVRAAISGLRKRGCTVDSEHTGDAPRRYRLAEPERGSNEDPGV